jgi:8-oxo-dGTP pyrophosphatase MutT (NUDIX family)
MRRRSVSARTGPRGRDGARRTAFAASCARATNSSAGVELIGDAAEDFRRGGIELSAGRGGAMEKKHGPWTIRGTRERFRNDLMTVCEDEVTRPDGSEGTYATVRMKDGVTVLAVDEEGRAYFAREFRYAVGFETVEAVGGGIEEGEPPAEAARRELREELGIEAEELIELGAVQHITSLVNSRSTLFLARRLTFRRPDTDSGEVIDAARMPLAEAAAKALDGQLIHSTTCLLVLRAQHHLKKGDGG